MLPELLGIVRTPTSHLEGKPWVNACWGGFVLGVQLFIISMHCNYSRAEVISFHGRYFTNLVKHGISNWTGMFTDCTLCNSCMYVDLLWKWLCSCHWFCITHKSGLAWLFPYSKLIQALLVDVLQNVVFHARVMNGYEYVLLSANNTMLLWLSLLPRKSCPWCMCMGCKFLGSA